MLSALVGRPDDLDIFDSAPIRSEGWQEVRVEADVHPEAEYLNISVEYGGLEPAWVDDVSVTVLGEAAPPRSLAWPIVAAGALVGAALLVLRAKKRIGGA